MKKGIILFLIGAFLLYTLLWHMEIYVWLGEIITAIVICTALLLCIIGLILTMNSYDESF